MKHTFQLSISKLKISGIFLIFFILCSVNSQAQQRSFYQLKVYTVANKDQVVRMDDFLQKAYLPALHRAGITQVGVFNTINEDTASPKRIYVLIPFKSLDQFEKLAENLDKDKQFQSDGKDYIHANFDHAPYQRFESILLKAFKGMPGPGKPMLEGQLSERVYELRSYQGATEELYERKVEMFNDGGEIGLFQKLGFNPIFFGEVISGPTMPNLMYLTSFSSVSSQKEHWKAFSNHPDWIAIKDLEKYKNTVSKIEVVMLRPANYSGF